MYVIKDKKDNTIAWVKYKGYNGFYKTNLEACVKYSGDYGDFLLNLYKIQGKGASDPSKFCELIENNYHIYNKVTQLYNNNHHPILFFVNSAFFRIEHV